MGPVTLTQQETEMELAVMKCMISPLVRFDPIFFSWPENWHESIPFHLTLLTEFLFKIF